MNTQEEISDMKARVAEYEAAQLAQQIPADFKSFAVGYYTRGAASVMHIGSPGWVANIRTGPLAVPFQGPVAASPVEALNALRAELGRCVTALDAAWPEGGECLPKGVMP